MYSCSSGRRQHEESRRAAEGGRGRARPRRARGACTARTRTCPSPSSGILFLSNQQMPVHADVHPGVRQASMYMYKTLRHGCIYRQR